MNHPHGKKKAADAPKTLADIGLGDIPLPTALSTTKAQRAASKKDQKRASVQQTKQAINFLAESRKTLEEHRTILKEQQRKDSMEKALLKRERRDEHRSAQQARDEAAKHDEVRTVQFQKQQAVERVEYELSEKRRKALEQKMEDLETEQRAKLAPKAVFCPVKRVPAIVAVRDSLPVRQEEQQIMEAVLDTDNTCVLVAGETGSGKTTQVPQFLWEAGFGQPGAASQEAGRTGLIAVTEPRRVAAIAMARRVAEELNEPFGKTVCYSVRYSNNMSPECRLKFMTEGVLLREVQEDLLLSKYSAVVVDEAHERSVSCDVLLGMLSRIVKLRKDMAIENPERHQPLRLVIMSATLRVSDFRDNRRLFSRPPPLIEVPVRRFPVHNHFARRTEMHKYVDEAYRKVKQIHKKLPPGGILVFLSTQREIELLSEKLTKYYEQTRVFLDHFKIRAKRRQELLEAAAAAADAASENTVNSNDKQQPAETTTDEFGFAAEDYQLDDARESRQMKRLGKRRHRLSVADPDGDDEDAQEDPENAARAVDQGWDDDDDDDDDDDERGQEDEEDIEEEDDARGDFDSMHILPLYAMLSQEQQQKVFEAPPEGKRLCVVATNIAETSITIPGIRFVVDVGRVRTRRLGPDGVDRYQVEMISQASAEQRSGRAGRTSVGHCYRLYTPAVYANLMPKHNDPELLRVPLDSVVVMMKSMRIDNVRKFPFPAPPSPDAIETALTHLRSIGALDKHFRCTSVGHRVGHYPVAPRLARMLLLVEGVIARQTEAVSVLEKGGGHVVATFLSSSFSSSSPSSSSSNSGSSSSISRVTYLQVLREALLSIVAIITSGLDPFLQSQPIPKVWRHVGSDFISLLIAFSWFANSNSNGRRNNNSTGAGTRRGPAPPSVCTEHGLVHKILFEALQLRKQLDRCMSLKCSKTTPSASSMADEGKQKKAQEEEADEDEANLLEDADMEEGDVTFASQHDNSAKTKTATATMTSSSSTQFAGKFAGGQQQQQQQQMAAAAAASLFTLPFDIRLDECIRRLICVGLVDQVCKRASADQCQKQGFKYVATQNCGKTPYWDVFRRRVVFVHGRSSVASRHPAPEYLVYMAATSQDRRSGTAIAATAIASQDFSSLQEDQQQHQHQQKVYLRGVTAVDVQWLEACGFRDPDELDDDEE